MPLNPKQQAFVREYLKDKNATRAAKAAGYSKKTAHATGPENLSKPGIKKAIEAGLAKQAEKAGISAERTVQEIAAIAYQKLSTNELKKLSGNKLKALELLGKRFNLFTENLQITGKDGGPQVIFHTFANGTEAPDEPASE